MSRAKKETVISYVCGDDEIHIRSWDKRLNKAIRTPSDRSRAAMSEAGKQHTGNLKHQKEKAPP